MASLGADSVGFPRSRRKRKLDLVKCDRCRIDKQKCLPVRREWPGQKCGRCAKKDLPCSDGQRATRKRKAEKIKTSVRVSLLGKDEPFSDIDTSEAVEWSFPLSFHKLMSVTLNRLQRLKEESQKFFLGDLQVNLFSSQHHDPSSSLDGFMQGFRKLEDEIFCRIERVLDDRESATNRATIGAITTQIFSEPPRISEPQDGCAICDRTAKEARLLRHFDPTKHAGLHFVAKYEKLTTYCWASQHWDEKHDSKSIQEELEELASFWAPFHEKIFQNLTVYGFGAGPSYLSKHASAMPDELASIPRKDESLGSVKDLFGRTWLHHCLDTGVHPLESSDGMLLYGEDLYNHQDLLGRTPLHIACQKYDIQVAESLLKEGANAGLKTVFGSLALHYAAASGSVRLCEKLILRGGFRPDDMDNAGHTPLYYAVKQRHNEAVKLLLSLNHHVSPDRHDNQCTPPPLIQAILASQVEVVGLLLASGANPDTEYRCLTASDYAVRGNHGGIVKLLEASKSGFRSALKRDQIGTPKLVEAREGKCSSLSSVAERNQRIQHKSSIVIHTEDDFARWLLSLIADID